MNELRARLKESSKDMHQHLEASVDNLGLLASQNGYRHYLQGFSQARIMMEKRLDDAEIASLYPCWPSHHLSQALAEDLHDLALPPVFVDTVKEPRLSASEALGVLYVLEGSALGAKTVFERAQQLGYSAEFGARHLARQRDHINDWRIFLTVLDTFDAKLLDEAACIASARHVFTVFERAYNAVTPL